MCAGVSEQRVALRTKSISGRRVSKFAPSLLICRFTPFSQLQTRRHSHASSASLLASASRAKASLHPSIHLHPPIHPSIHPSTNFAHPSHHLNDPLVTVPSTSSRFSRACPIRAPLQRVVVAIRASSSRPQPHPALATHISDLLPHTPLVRYHHIA